MHRILVSTLLPDTVELTGESFHYLARVLRLQKGTEVVTFDGQGKSRLARVEEISPASVMLRFINEIFTDEKPRPLVIVQSLIKGEKLEWVLQKGTELGATHFVLVHSQHCDVKPKNESVKLERWQKIVAQAARQSGRNTVPEVRGIFEVSKEFPADLAQTVPLLLNEHEKRTSLGSALKTHHTPVLRSGCRLWVGPEGGFSLEEVQTLTSDGAISVTLGNHILRTETAAMAALTIIQHQWGNLG